MGIQFSHFDPKIDCVYSEAVLTWNRFADAVLTCTLIFVSKEKFSLFKVKKKYV